MINEERQQKIHVLNKNEIDQDSIQLVRVDPVYDDISLIDLWLVLTKHKKILMSIVFAAMLLGVFYAMSKPTLYNYSATLQIGAMMVSDGGKQHFESIESPENALSKLTESYIPSVQYAYLKENPSLKKYPDISARIPKNSSLIILESKGVEEDSDIHLDVIRRIIERLRKDHKLSIDITKGEYKNLLKRAEIALSDLENPMILTTKLNSIQQSLLDSKISIEKLKDERLIKVAKQQLMSDIASHKNKLSSLDDEAKQLSSELKRLADVDSLLETQITGLAQTITNELKNRKETAKNISTGPGAMTMLLIDNQIQSNRDRLARLEERLYIKQYNLREKLENQIKENKRMKTYERALIVDVNNNLQKLDIDNKHSLQKLLANHKGLEIQLSKIKLDHNNQILKVQQEIQGYSLKLKGLRETQSLTPPMQSLKPVSSKRKLIVVVSLVAGLFLAIFVVFILEFLSKVKEKSLQHKVS